MYKIISLIFRRMAFLKAHCLNCKATNPFTDNWQLTGSIHLCTSEWGNILGWHLLTAHYKIQPWSCAYRGWVQGSENFLMRWRMHKYKVHNISQLQNNVNSESFFVHGYLFFVTLVIFKSVPLWVFCNREVYQGKFYIELLKLQV